MFIKKYLDNFMIPKYRRLKFFDNPKDTIEHYVKENNLPLLEKLQCDYNTCVSSIKYKRNNIVKCYYFMNYIPLDKLCMKAAKFDNLEILDFGLKMLDKYRNFNSFDILQVKLHKKILKEATKYNSKSILKYMKDNDYYDEYTILKAAAYTGNIEIINTLENIDYNIIAIYSAIGGKFEMTKWVLSNISMDVTQIAIEATKYNNLHFLIELSINDLPYNDILYISIKNKYFDITNWVLENFPYDICYLAKGIAEIGNYETLKQLEFAKFNISCYEVFKHLTIGGHLEIIKNMNDNNKFIKTIAKYASKFGHRKIILWCLEQNFKDYEFIAKNAANGGFYDILLLIEDNIQNFDQIAQIALNKNHTNIVQWCLKKNLNELNKIKNISAFKCNFKIIDMLI